MNVRQQTARPRKNRRPARTALLSLFLIAAFLLAACSGGAAPVDSGAGGQAPPAAEERLEPDGEAMPDTGASEGDAMSADSTMSEDGAMAEGEMKDGEGELMAAEGEMADEHDGAAGEGETLMEDGEDAMAEGEMKAGEGEMMEGEAEMMDLPAWFNVPLTEATTGETFTIAGLQGKVVLVETLAMWCSNCMQQQRQVLALHEQLGERDDFVSLGLDIDPNENSADLKEYVARNGFTWTYAIAPRELAAEIGNQYGQQFLNPPSTPMLIIDRHGNVHPLPFGIKSAADLAAALQPFLDEGM